MHVTVCGATRNSSVWDIVGCFAQIKTHFVYGLPSVTWCNPAFSIVSTFWFHSSSLFLLYNFFKFFFLRLQMFLKKGSVGCLAFHISEKCFLSLYASVCLSIYLVCFGMINELFGHNVFKNKFVS